MSLTLYTGNDGGSLLCITLLKTKFFRAHWEGVLFRRGARQSNAIRKLKDNLSGGPRGEEVEGVLTVLQRPLEGVVESL